MRIISGKYFKKFINVVGRSRPPLKLIRQYIFDFIENNFGFKEKVILDLCSGSGSFGLEALSREAEFAYFFEEDYQIAQNLRKTINDFGINNAKIIIKNVKYLPNHNLENVRGAKHQIEKTGNKQNKQQKKMQRFKTECANSRQEVKSHYQQIKAESGDSELFKEFGAWGKLSRRDKKVLEKRIYREEMINKNHEIIKNRIKQDGETEKLMHGGNQREEVISPGKGFTDIQMSRPPDCLAEGEDCPEVAMNQGFADAEIPSSQEELVYGVNREQVMSHGFIYSGDYPEAIIQEKLTNRKDYREEIMSQGFADAERINNSQKGFTDIQMSRPPDCLAEGEDCPEVAMNQGFADAEMQKLMYCKKGHQEKISSQEEFADAEIPSSQEELVYRTSLQEKFMYDNRGASFQKELYTVGYTQETSSQKGEDVVANESSSQKAQLQVPSSAEDLLTEIISPNEQNINYKKADLIFFDPPFGHDYSQEVIDKIIKKSWASKNAILIFRSGDEFENKNQNYDLIAHKKIGCSFIYIYKIIC